MCILEGERTRSRVPCHSFMGSWKSRVSIWPAPGAAGAACPSPVRYGKTCARKASVLFVRCISFLQGAKARGLAFNQTSATIISIETALSKEIGNFSLKCHWYFSCHSYLGHPKEISVCFQGDFCGVLFTNDVPWLPLGFGSLSQGE